MITETLWIICYFIISEEVLRVEASCVRTSPQFPWLHFMSSLIWSCYIMPAYAHQIWLRVTCTHAKITTDEFSFLLPFMFCHDCSAAVSLHTKLTFARADFLLLQMKLRKHTKRHSATKLMKRNWDANILKLYQPLNPSSSSFTWIKSHSCVCAPNAASKHTKRKAKNYSVMVSEL